MKNIVFIIPLLAGGLISCNNTNFSHEESHEVEEHNVNEIILHPEEAERFGVTTSIIEPHDFNETLSVSGEIFPAQCDEYTISATKSGIVHLMRDVNLGTTINKGEPVATISANSIIGGDMDKSAKITLENAEQEYKRIEQLYEDKIVTEREYIAAKETYLQALNAYKPRTESPISDISGTISMLYVKNGDYVEIGSPIATVIANNSLILRADLPERYGKFIVKSANFRPSYTDSVYSVSEFNGKLMHQSETSIRTGYIPIYFAINNDNRLITKSYADIYLIGATKHNALTVPIEALVEEQGDFFVFEKVDAECYTKHMVSIGISDGQNVEILSGINPGMNIVTSGAIIVKLATNAGAVPGHSHEH